MAGFADIHDAPFGQLLRWWHGDDPPPPGFGEGFCDEVAYGLTRHRPDGVAVLKRALSIGDEAHQAAALEFLAYPGLADDEVRAVLLQAFTSDRKDLRSRALWGFLHLAYYPIIAAGPLALWATGQREAMHRAMTTIMATFYVCYTTFLLFPVVGPRHIFPAADNLATRTPIAQLTAQFIEHVAAWGAAFPSSHVAVSVAATVAALLEWRMLGAALVVPTTLLALGSVYGQFHYAVDVLAGLGVGLAVAAVVWLTSRQRSEQVEESTAQRSVPNTRSQSGLDTPKRVSGSR